MAWAPTVPTSDDSTLFGSPAPGTLRPFPKTGCSPRIGLLTVRSSRSGRSIRGSRDVRRRRSGPASLKIPPATWAEGGLGRCPQLLSAFLESQRERFASPPVPSPRPNFRRTAGCAIFRIQDEDADVQAQPQASWKAQPQDLHGHSICFQRVGWHGTRVPKPLKLSRGGEK